MSLILLITNYIGIIAFSISGSMKAIEKKMDLLGVITLGFSTSLAGGILADLLLGITPPCFVDLFSIIQKFINNYTEYYLWERVSTRGIGASTTRTL